VDATIHLSIDVAFVFNKLTFRTSPRGEAPLLHFMEFLRQSLERQNVGAVTDLAGKILAGCAIAFGQPFFRQRQQPAQ
jgi:hypothetical protein